MRWYYLKPASSVSRNFLSQEISDELVKYTKWPAAETTQTDFLFATRRMASWYWQKKIEIPRHCPTQCKEQPGSWQPWLVFRFNIFSVNILFGKVLCETVIFNHAKNVWFVLTAQYGQYMSARQRASAHEYMGSSGGTSRQYQTQSSGSGSKLHCVLFIPSFSL